MSTSFRKQIIVLACGCVFGLVLPALAASELTVVENTNAVTLVDNIVGGTGVSVVSGSETYTGSSVAAGTFTGGTNVGGGFFEEGVILTSGRASFARDALMSGSGIPNNNVNDQPGPFDEIDLGASWPFPSDLPGGLGDADLDALIGPGLVSTDAASLEFEFDTTGGDLSFNFIFASEEYNDFVDSDFNDVFGFFVDGVNVAVVPGTSNPISVNTVNADEDTDNGTSFFIDNTDITPGNTDPTDGTAPFDIEYDGFTTPFSVTVAVAPGAHTMKFAIADGSEDTTGSDEDYFVDSAVFIETNSFSVATVPLPNAAWMGLSLLGGVGLVQLTRHKMRRLN